MEADHHFWLWKLIIPAIVTPVLTIIFKAMVGNVFQITRDKFNVSIFFNIYIIGSLYFIALVFNGLIGLGFLKEGNEGLFNFMLIILILTANVLCPIVSCMLDISIYIALVNKIHLYKEQKDRNYTVLRKGSNKFLKDTSIVGHSINVDTSQSEMRYFGKKETVFTKESGYYNFVKLERKELLKSWKEIDSNWYFTIALPIILYIMFVLESIVFYDELKIIKIILFMECILLIINFIAIRMKGKTLDNIKLKNEKEINCFPKEIKKYIT